MFNRLLGTFMLLFCIHGWALNCSFPQTVSDQRLNASCARIFSNEKGDVILTWISSQGKVERLEVSYKTQSSDWSSPELLSNWEKEIYPNPCFVNAQGDLFATWETEKEDEFLLHIAEKIKRKPWKSYLNWMSSGTAFFVSDTGFDSTGNLIFIGAKTIPYVPKTTNEYIYKNTIPAIVISTKLPAHIEPELDILPLETTSYSSSEIKVAINKNSIGYAFWISNTLDEYLLMCQKVANNHFVLEPEIICALGNYVYELEVALNEKEDIVIAYLDGNDNGNIITKIQNSWSKPFLFTNKKEDPTNVGVAIDSAGNAMVIWEAEVYETDVVKTIYKPINQTWQSPTLFLTDEALNWNPKVQPDGAGNFIAVWQQEQRKRNAIVGRTFSTETQAWSDLQRLSSQEESCFAYTYSFWAPGKGYIAWTMSPNGYDRVVQVAELFD